jgi:formate dehydrogenase (hydrogenase)
MLGARSRRRDPTEESERQHEGGAPRRPVEPDHAASVGGLVVPCKIAFCTRSNAEGRLPSAKGVALESGWPDRPAYRKMEGAMASMAMAPVRLTEPMVRENGELRTATWDEALDRAAEGLKRAMERNPGWGAGLFSCSKATNEMNFVAQKFARQVLGTNNIDSCNRT